MEVVGLLTSPEWKKLFGMKIFDGILVQDMTSIIVAITPKRVDAMTLPVKGV